MQQQQKRQVKQRMCGYKIKVKTLIPLPKQPNSRSAATAPPKQLPARLPGLLAFGLVCLRAAPSFAFVRRARQMIHAAAFGASCIVCCVYPTVRQGWIP